MAERTFDLKQVRVLAKLNQEEAAKLLHIHRVTYGKLEQNPMQLSLGQAHLLAEAAGISVNQIKI